MSGSLAADPWEFAASMFEPKPDLADLTVWAKERLGEYLWAKQREIAASLLTSRYTAVQSCHDAGKSYVASRAIANWIDQHEPGEAFVISTAPTNAQVAAILWREIGRAHRKGGFAGSITASGYPMWKIGPELVGYGRKPSDYNESAFQGIHARYVLVVIDEATGVPKQIFEAVDALATNENARVLAIGNPDDPTSYFATACKPDSGWNTIRIDGLRTPNMTRERVAALTQKCEQCRRAGAEQSLLQRLMAEEGIEYDQEDVPEGLRDLLLSPLWVEERLHRWVGAVRPHESVAKKAAESPIFESKVRGRFPTSSSDGVIPLGWVERAIDRWHAMREANPDLSTIPGKRVFGVDVASTGNDETSIATRQGPFLASIATHRKSDTMEVAGLVTAALNYPASVAVLDVIGVGTGVYDRLRELSKAVVPFNAARSGKKMKDRTKQFVFLNHRAAAWWNLRELLDPANGANICLPPDEDLKADLTAPKYHVGSNAAIQVEAKDDVRKRLGRSTDRGDSVVQAFWIDAAPASPSSGQGDTLSWWDGASEDALRWNVEGMSESWLRE